MSPVRCSGGLTKKKKKKLLVLIKSKDLEEAITCHRQALALLSQGHPNHSDSLNNLGDTVIARFQISFPVSGSNITSKVSLKS
jgi:hypothetical protein